MSMLSAQRDRLRKVAGELQSIIDGLNKGHITYDGLVDTLNFSILCLNDAADTIWQLRNDCVDLRLENAKLRGERDHWHVEQVHAYGNWEDVHKRASELEAENAKLREQVVRMYRNMEGVIACSTDTVWVNSLVTLRDCMDEHMESMAELGIPPRDYEIRMRELGIEADHHE